MANTTAQLIQNLKDARRVSTPIVEIVTPDPMSSMFTIRDAVNGKNPPMLRWDCSRGICHLNEQGKAALQEAGIQGNMVLDLAQVFEHAMRLPERTVLIVVNAHNYLDAGLRSPEAIAARQALWNLRDQFKQDQRTVYLLSPGMTLPADLKYDVVTFEQPFPRSEELAAIVRQGFVNAQAAEPEQSVVDRAVEALLGMPPFPAEDAVARNLRGGVLNVPGLWDRKISMVNAMKGLRIHFDPADSFAMLGGMKNGREFGQLLVDGKLRPNVVVLLDEVEKQQMQGGGSPNDPGSSQLGQLLSWQDGVGRKKKPGFMLVGVQGSGKTLLARMIAAYAGVPLIIMNVAEMRGEFQGNTERDTAAALRVIDALGDENVLVIATCNRIESLPPEFLSRFTLGTFFVDLPDEQEKADIWAIYMKQYELPKQPFPNDKDWSGREIAACAHKAWAFNSTLVEAAKTVNPAARAMGDKLTRMRQHAEDSGFISAAYEGGYKVPTKGGEATSNVRRVES